MNYLIGLGVCYAIFLCWRAYRDNAEMRRASERLLRDRAARGENDQWLKDAAP